MVRIFLTNGADVEHQNDNGHTPLMEAASCGHVGMCIRCACVSESQITVLYQKSHVMSR